MKHDKGKDLGRGDAVLRVHPTDDEVAQQARLVVAAYSENAADARELLSMLGLMESDSRISKP